jgi:hypothetical protein
MVTPRYNNRGRDAAERDLGRKRDVASDYHARPVTHKARQSGPGPRQTGAGNSPSTIR